MQRLPSTGTHEFFYPFSPLQHLDRNLTICLLRMSPFLNLHLKAWRRCLEDHNACLVHDLHSRCDFMASAGLQEDKECVMVGTCTWKLGASIMEVMKFVSCDSCAKEEECKPHACVIIGSPLLACLEYAPKKRKYKPYARFGEDKMGVLGWICTKRSEEKPSASLLGVNNLVLVWTCTKERQLGPTRIFRESKLLSWSILALGMDMPLTCDLFSHLRTSC